MRGATALPQLTFEIPEVLARIGRDRISVLPGPPTIYQSILSHPERGDHDLSCLRLAVTGAAPTPVELIRRMRDELGFETIITGYGLPECCGIVSMCRFDDDPETIATTSGRAIPGIEEKPLTAARGDTCSLPVPAAEVARSSVPDTSGRSVLRILIGIPDSAAGIRALGWSTVAPKYASSIASS